MNSGIPQDPSGRVAPRLPIETSVYLEFEKFSGFITEYSENISEGGMFIKSDEPKPVGSVVSFEFRLADNFRLIQGLGEVVWVRATSGGPEEPAGMGVRFHEIEQQSRQLIRTMVANHVKRGGKAFALEETSLATDSVSETAATSSPANLEGAPATTEGATPSPPTSTPEATPAAPAEFTPPPQTPEVAPAVDDPFAAPTSETDFVDLVPEEVEDPPVVSEMPAPPVAETIPPAPGVSPESMSTPESPPVATGEQQPEEGKSKTLEKDFEALFSVGDEPIPPRETTPPPPDPPPAAADSPLVDSLFSVDEANPEPAPEIPSEPSIELPSENIIELSPADQEMEYESHVEAAGGLGIPGWVKQVLAIGGAVALVLAIFIFFHAQIAGFIVSILDMNEEPAPRATKVEKAQTPPPTATTAPTVAPKTKPTQATASKPETEAATPIAATEKTAAPAEERELPVAKATVVPSPIPTEPTAVPPDPSPPPGQEKQVEAVTKPPPKAVEKEVLVTETPPPSPLSRIDRITWKRETDRLVLTLWGNHPFSPKSFVKIRLNGGKPREVIKISGVQQPFLPSRMPVRTPQLKSIRTGLHKRITPPELHVVLDLAHARFRVTKIEADGQKLRIVLGQ